jgi:DNA-binding transcriptional MerR regulator
VELKKTYSAREVASITGLSARQLQSWDARRLFRPAIAPKRTAAGGFTERRYTPIDLLELMVLADLHRQGMTAARIRQLLDALRTHFGVRLFDAIGGTGRLALLTDGADVYVRTARGEFYNVLRAPSQPLLVVGTEPPLKELTAKVRRTRRRRPRTNTSRGPTRTDTDGGRS